MKAKVSFEVEIPEGVSRDEVEAWLRYELNETGTIESGNPLLRYFVEPADEIQIEFDHL